MTNKEELANDYAQMSEGIHNRREVKIAYEAFLAGHDAAVTVIGLAEKDARTRASLSFRKTCDYFRDNFGEMLCRRPNRDLPKCDMSCLMGMKFLAIYDNEK